MAVEILCHGETEAERKSYAMGYRMGMFAASQILLDKGKADGEVAGACPAGPYTDAANMIQARTPKGEIVTTHTLR